MLLSSLGTIAVFFFLLWIGSLVLGDASIVDRFWGVAFFVIASAASAATDGYATRAHLVLALTTIWGVRLSLYITARNAGAGEDFRYRAMRRQWGDRFPVVSLFSVFGLQALIAWIVSWPLQAAIMAGEPARLTLLDLAGTALWATGFFFEAVGDWQLARFKADPANRGKLMDGGLWRYTRHPNYFGDALLWWGFWLIAGATGAWWTAVGPLVMTILLVNVSGVAMLERQMRRTRPEYEDYCRRTSAFLPLPPRTS